MIGGIQDIGELSFGAFFPAFRPACFRSPPLAAARQSLKQIPGMGTEAGI